MAKGECTPNREELLKAYVSGDYFNELSSFYRASDCLMDAAKFESVCPMLFSFFPAEKKMATEAGTLFIDD